MLPRRKLLYNLLILSDSIILMFALILSYSLMHADYTFSIAGFLQHGIRIMDGIFTLILLACWHSIYECCHMYRSKRLDSKIWEIIDIIKAVTFCSMLLFIADRLFKIFNISIDYIVIFWSTAIFITIAFRTALRFFLRLIRRSGINLRNVLIVGTNPKALSIAELIRNDAGMGYNFRGFIDSSSYSESRKIPIIGTPDGLPEILAHQVIDEIIIALPIRTNYEMLQKVVLNAEMQGITIRYNYNLFDTLNARYSSDEFNNFPCLTMSCWPYSELQFLLKRMLDTVVASFVLILTLPLFLVIAFLIKTTSHGPVFFKQQRVGFNKRVFTLLKFRTMVVNAESLQKDLEKYNEMDGAVFKIKNDPRVTRIGRILRKTSIDELPQFINILRGEMSLVGPRPLPMRDYEHFTEDWQRRRLSVLPGLTCTWQISGRNKISFEQWMQMDLDYIDNWTLLLDLKILLQTVPAVFMCRGSS